MSENCFYFAGSLSYFVIVNYHASEIVMNFYSDILEMLAPETPN